MNSRERVLTALAHREPDRVPYDLGATEVTGIHVGAYGPLRRYLGLPEVETRTQDLIQNQARLDDDIRDRLKVDAGIVAASFPPELSTFWEDDEYRFLRDRFGIVRRMPKDGGLYYDIWESPLAGEVSLDQIDAYPLPDGGDPRLFEGMRDACLHVRDVEQRAVVIWSYSTGAFALSGWLRGIESFLMDLAADPSLACRMMDRVVEMKLAYLEQALRELGDVVDVVCDGDDLGSQDSLLISPDTYRRYIKPRHKEIFDFIHARTNAKVFLHTDGAVRPVIADLIEIGVDIINPVQVSADGMDSAPLKRDFGSEITFWGGGIDTQHVFGTATPAEIRAEVRQRIADFMPGGGFVFTPVHNIQANVPPENIMAMWDALQEFGGYRPG